MISEWSGTERDVAIVSQTASAKMYDEPGVDEPRRKIPPLRIAQLAPLFERIPPNMYGGTERVVSYLTEELVRRGHDVTLFASGDSVTSARLVPGCERSLRLGDPDRDHVALHLAMLLEVYEHARDFDVIHCHTDYLTVPFA